MLKANDKKLFKSVPFAFYQRKQQQLLIEEISAYLNKEKALLESLDQINKLIESARQFNYTLKCLPLTIGIELFERKKTYLSELINTAQDVNLILEYLPEEQRI